MTPEEDVSRLFAAAHAFAEGKHGQQRYGDEPHMTHVLAVVALARQYGLSTVQVLAAYLHDTVEDTDTSLEELTQHFGSEVAELVDSATGTGANRKERQRRIVAKLERTPMAIDVKLCDRIANVEAAIRDNKTKLLAMYQAEMPLYAPVFRQGNAVLYARLMAAVQPQASDRWKQQGAFDRSC